MCDDLKFILCFIWLIVSNNWYLNWYSSNNIHFHSSVNYFFNWYHSTSTLFWVKSNYFYRDSREGQSTNRLPFWEWHNYSYPKAKMRAFIVSLCLKARPTLSNFREPPQGEDKKLNCKRDRMATEQELTQCNLKALYVIFKGIYTHTHTKIGWIRRKSTNLRSKQPQENEL